MSEKQYYKLLTLLQAVVIIYATLLRLDTSPTENLVVSIGCQKKKRAKKFLNVNSHINLTIDHFNDPHTYVFTRLALCMVKDVSFYLHTVLHEL
jgi:hypothetical protein